MWHPWRELRDHHSDWTVKFAILPAGILGTTDFPARVITLDSRLHQGQRRSVLTHELGHVWRQDHGPCCRRDEAEIDQMAARLLIPIDRMVDVCRWARTAHEAADELWVDVRTFNIRVEHLHPAERGAIVAAIRARDDAA